ncbi:MAG: ATP-dependent DNA ligase [Chloroflexi bacterium]|nr:ATP-dependent DNA ligase [Chloroflexota bacterium]
MHFSELARTFQRLEETSSRTALTQILADLFRQTPADEVGPTTYLLQGRIAPAFVPLELGMGVQHVASAIADAYGTDREGVLARFDQVGDLGTAAGQLAAQSGSASQGTGTPSVREVFDRLAAIARLTGPGSVQGKVGQLARLLAELDPLSATYLCRIPLGALRLGVGDLTVLDAYSVAQAGNKSLRPRLERAYNETSDLGLIGTTLWTGGVEAVDRLFIRVGNPVRPMLAERLPSAEAILEKLGRCAVENKYDGFRCQIHKSGDEVSIYSRSLEEMSGAFPELLAATRQQIGAETAIFEGEALAYNPLSEEYLPFQQTMRRRRKHGIDATAAELPLRLFAFDVLYADGENLTSRGYTDRRALLRELIRPGETILGSETHLVETPEALVTLFEDAIQNGLEGIMAKKPDSSYQAGARSYNWVKLKRAQAGHLRDTVDCVIVGYLYGRGRRAALGLGALLVAVYDPDRDIFTSITKIGTGLKDADWRAVLERCAPYTVEHQPARVESRLAPSVWVEPAVVIEVLADEITRSPLYTAGAVDGQPGYALRFPRLVSFREADKRPEDATTVHEVVELYNQQGAKQVPG